MTAHELATILILLVGAALIWSIVRGGSRRPTPKPIGKVVRLDGFQKLGYQLAVQGRPTEQEMRAYAFAMRERLAAKNGWESDRERAQR